VREVKNAPAFPCDWDYINSNREAANGMSLRQYFAGKALQGFCANPAVFASNSTSGWDLVNCNEEQLINRALLLADLMIAQSAAKAGA